MSLGGAALGVVERTRILLIGNAFSIRDLRSQLRGTKAIVVWAFYLGLLVFLASMIYASSMRDGKTSVAEVQVRLNGFYHGIMAILGAMIALITPGLTAGAVASERQRKSLDLVFTTPATPLDLLLGKWLSAMRYVWLLLVLSLPIASVCVVLGGATWNDVLSAYLLLAFCGMLLTAFGLLISSIASTVTAAIILTYFFVGIYAFFVSMFSGIAMAGTTGGDAPWIGALSPFMTSFMAPTHTMIGTTQVPNVFVAGVFSMALGLVFVSGAASALSPYASLETKVFRVVLAIFTVVISAALIASLNAFTAGMGAISDPWAASLQIGGWLLFTYSLFFTSLFVWSWQGPIRSQPRDGWWAPRHMLLGTPGGGLPYALVLTLSIVVGAGLVLALQGHSLLSGSLALGLAYMAGYVLLWFGTSWVMSSLVTVPTAARVITTAIVLMALLLPLPVSAALSASGPQWQWAELLNPFYPITGTERLATGPMYGLFFGFVGALLTYLGQSRMKRMVVGHGGTRTEPSTI